MSAPNKDNMTAKQRAVDALHAKDSSGNTVSLDFNNTTTSTTASNTATGSTLPAKAAGYVEVLVGGKTVKIPFYAA